MRTAAVVVAAALSLVVGCSPADNPSSPAATPTAVSPSTTASKSPSVTPGSPSPSASAGPTFAPSYPSELPTQTAENAAIIASWQEYWRVYQKYASDPFGYTDFTETQYVTTGEAQNTILAEISGLRNQKLRAVGGARFTDVQLAPVKGQDGSRTVVLSYCIHTNGIVVLHIDTGKRFESGMAPTLSEKVTMSEGKDGKWRVARLQNREGGC